MGTTIGVDGGVGVTGGGIMGDEEAVVEVEADWIALRCTRCFCKRKKKHNA